MLRTFAFLCLLALAACTGTRDTGDPCAGFTPDECALRQAFGIPPGARTVIVFDQTSHLDIDWQHTFPWYYDHFVETALLDARKMLDEQPHAFYSVAEMAWLEHHLQVHPEEADALKADAGRGALRIVGGGITSPDTLLPETEMLAHDLLFGVKFAEDTLGAHPTAAWVPDSFGHAGTLPDVLAAAGYDSVAFSRIDGAPDLWQEIGDPGIQPLPGSTAATLQALGSADFLWHGPGGGTVLAHFMAAPGLYCMGDNIDYQEPIEVPGGHVGPYQGDDPSFTDARIDQYVSELRPWAVTRYLFVPVGCDFQAPKERLLDYLIGYDVRRYPHTGVWAVAAPFDDYAALVRTHQDQLPEITGSLTPYDMGFYDSRGDLKRAVRDAANPFWVGDTFAVALGADGTTLARDAAPALEHLTWSDHHDFITGTASDDVVQTEQMPLLDAARAAGEDFLGKVAGGLAARIPVTSGATARVLALNASGIPGTGVAEVTVADPGGLMAVSDGAEVPMEVDGDKVRLELSGVPSFGWQAIDLVPGTPSAVAPAVGLAMYDAGGTATQDPGQAVKVVLSNDAVVAEWDRQDGAFSLDSLQEGGTELLAGPSATLRSYADDGGLWRLGNEMGGGCSFTLEPPAAADDTMQVVQDSALGARVRFTSADGDVREAALSAGDTGLSLDLVVSAPVGVTRTLALSLAVPEGAVLTTSVAGGVEERPPQRVFTPTFWPAVELAQVGGQAVLLRQSTGVRMSTPGALELMVARNAQKEGCDVEGGVGDDTGPHHVSLRLARAATPAAALQAAQAFARGLVPVVVGTDQASSTDLPVSSSLLSVDGDGIVSTLEPAERGDGVILRAELVPGPLAVHLSATLSGRQVRAVDLVERDGAELGTAGDTISFDRDADGALPSVRLY